MRTIGLVAVLLLMVIGTSVSTVTGSKAQDCQGINNKSNEIRTALEKVAAAKNLTLRGFTVGPTANPRMQTELSSELRAALRSVAVSWTLPEGQAPTA